MNRKRILVLSLFVGLGSACAANKGQRLPNSPALGQSESINLVFQNQPISFSKQKSVLTLQVLHNSDQESGIAVLEDLPRFAKILGALKKEEPHTLILSSGDLFIPGPFFNATRGKGDIRLANTLGYQASALGNHEFDLGEKPLQRLIKAKKKYQGTTFPLLSANLDFSNSVLNAQYTTDISLGETMANKIAPSILLEVAQEKIGVIGATTENLSAISSPGKVKTTPVVVAVQKEVHRLQEMGVNKIILLAHLQQLNLEMELAKQITGVDIIISGGSDTLLSKAQDRLRKGQKRKGDYPVLLSAKDGNPLLLVNTSREYSYIGRLIVDFDAEGVLTGVSDKSGVIATDDEMPQNYQEEALPEGLVEILAEIKERIISLDGQIVGSTRVFLNGEREKVRTEETNLGNLLADIYQKAGEEYLQANPREEIAAVVSVVNGGGIRASIGDIEPGPLGKRVPPLANSLVDKKKGDISRLDIENAFRFNNELKAAALSGDEVVDWVEYGVANYKTGVTAGRFPQVSGFQFSFDPQRPSGQRVKSLVIHKGEKRNHISEKL